MFIFAVNRLKLLPQWKFVFGILTNKFKKTSTLLYSCCSWLSPKGGKGVNEAKKKVILSSIHLSIVYFPNRKLCLESCMLSPFPTFNQSTLCLNTLRLKAWSKYECVRNLKAPVSSRKFFSTPHMFISQHLQDITALAPSNIKTKIGTEIHIFVYRKRS